jgi:hypothetical protein
MAPSPVSVSAGSDPVVGARQEGADLPGSQRVSGTAGGEGAGEAPVCEGMTATYAQ